MPAFQGSLEPIEAVPYPYLKPHKHGCITIFTNQCLRRIQTVIEALFLSARVVTYWSNFTLLLLIYLRQLHLCNIARGVIRAHAKRKQLSESWTRTNLVCHVCVFSNTSSALSIRKVVRKSERVNNPIQRSLPGTLVLETVILSINHTKSYTFAINACNEAKWIALAPRQPGQGWGLRVGKN